MLKRKQKHNPNKIKNGIGNYTNHWSHMLSYNTVRQCFLWLKGHKLASTIELVNDITCMKAGLELVIL